MTAFDFDPPKTTAYRQRKPPLSPWFWVVMVSGFAVCSCCVAAIVATRFGPTSHYDSKATIRRHLSSSGLSDAEIASLSITDHGTPPAARSFVANRDSTICCTWGAFVIVGPEATINRVRAAVAGVEAPP